jgi:hypothetical protein
MIRDADDRGRDSDAECQRQDDGGSNARRPPNGAEEVTNVERDPIEEIEAGRSASILEMNRGTSKASAHGGGAARVMRGREIEMMMHLVAHLALIGVAAAPDVEAMPEAIDE